MLKKIKVKDLRLGMHLQALCGPWVDHPFWRTKFLLDDAADLQRLEESGLIECWIDPEKGLDVSDAYCGPALPRERAVAACRTVAASSDHAAVAAPACVDIEGELGRAAALLKQSRDSVLEIFNQARLGRAVDVERCQPLVADIAASIARNGDALIGLARLKTHDDYSYMHSVAVCALMVSLARRLGHDEARVRAAGVAGLLHDVGKALMPIEVLNKPGKLTAAEFDIMRLHPQRGHEVLLQGHGVPAAALDVCLHHHERIDGRGYPFGLAGGAISTLAKMGAVCDVYDAITSNRCYKAPWDPSDALAQMSGWSKEGHLDPDVFLAFVKSLGVYPVGSLVRMRSGRLAVVVEQHPQRLLEPKVKVFFSTRSSMPVPLELLDTASGTCSDAIAGRESNHVWKFPHLDGLWGGRPVIVRAPRAPA